MQFSCSFSRDGSFVFSYPCFKIASASSYSSFPIYALKAGYKLCCNSDRVQYILTVIRSHSHNLLLQHTRLLPYKGSPLLLNLPALPGSHRSPKCLSFRTRSRVTKRRGHDQNHFLILIPHFLSEHSASRKSLSDQQAVTFQSLFIKRSSINCNDFSVHSSAFIAYQLITIPIFSLFLSRWKSMENYGISSAKL